MNVERILCADWSKEERKRAVYEVFVGDRLVRRVPRDVRSVASLIEYARGLQRSTLVAFDAPIGVPASFFDAVRHSPQCSGVRGFLDWLEIASLGDCRRARDWCPENPFFSVPKGKGSLARFEEAARRVGVQLRRRVEVQTGGKSVFITAGVPGSVGCAALDIWRGLVAARRGGARFRVWPFEGLTNLEASGIPIIAEVYPRAAYATALVDDEPRPQLFVAKTNPAVRHRALDHLLGTRWVRSTSTRIEDLDAARANEDDFDALMTAAALMRCRVEGLPLWSAPLERPEAEGAILGTGLVDLQLRQTTFSVRG